MKSRQQLPANPIGFQPASNANCPQGFGRGWAVTPYATHFAGADWPMTSNRMFTRSRSPVPLRTITRGSFSAVADGVTVSPITPTTPFAVMTPDASGAVVRSHGAVVAPTAVSLDRNRGVAEGASPRSAPAEPEHATSNAPNRMTARTYSLHLPIYGGSPRGHVVYAGGPVVVAANSAQRATFDRVDRLRQQNVRVGQALRDMRGEDDPDVPIALNVDVGVVVCRAGRLGHPVDERHGALEALEGEGLRDRVPIPSPAGARGEKGTERGLIQSRLTLRDCHAFEPSLYAFRTRCPKVRYPDHTKTL